VRTLGERREVYGAVDVRRHFHDSRPEPEKLGATPCVGAAVSATSAALSDAELGERSTDNL
jgi:hypothetical protein